MWSKTLERTQTAGREVMGFVRSIAASANVRLRAAGLRLRDSLSDAIRHHPRRVLAVSAALTAGACLAWWTGVPGAAALETYENAADAEWEAGSASRAAALAQSERDSSVLPPLPDLPPPPKALDVLPAAGSTGRFLPVSEAAPAPEAALSESAAGDIDLASRGGAGEAAHAGGSQGAWLTGTIEDVAPVNHAARFPENFPSRQ